MNKLAGSSATIAARLAAVPEAASLVRQSASIAEALDRLDQDGRLIVAARLIGHALPAR